MENFLIEQGISNSAIKKMIKLRSQNCLSDLYLYKEEVIKNIESFKKVGITNLDDMIAIETDYFYQDNLVLNEKLLKLSKDQIQIINEDNTAIEFFI